MTHDDAYQVDTGRTFGIPFAHVTRSGVIVCAFRGWTEAHARRRAAAFAALALRVEGQARMYQAMERRDGAS
jgi:hypothetical protein